MTIPIEPGPFTFIERAGEALGRIGQVREERRRTALDEAQEKAKQMLALRAAGLMTPKQFQSPEVQSLFQAAGFGPVSSDPTSGEQLEYAKRDFLPTILGAQGNEDEKRALFGAPERGLTQQVDARIAGARAAVPKAQLEGATASAALPEAGATVVAGQQGTQDEVFNGIADRVVETLYAGTKRLPTPEEAFTAGLSDERAKAHGERINKQYYGAAIARLRAKLEAEKTARLNATSRAAGAAGTGLDDLLKIHRDQQTRITAEMNALPKPSESDFRLADLAKQNRQKGKPVPQIIAGAEQRVDQYNQRYAELQQQMNQVRGQLDRMLGNNLNTPGSTPPGTTGAPEKRAAAAEYEARVRGITDPAQRKRIADEIAKKYNIAPQQQRPSGAGGRF